MLPEAGSAGQMWPWKTAAEEPQPHTASHATGAACERSAPAGEVATAGADASQTTGSLKLGGRSRG